MADEYQVEWEYSDGNTVSIKTNNLKGYHLFRADSLGGLVEPWLISAIANNTIEHFLLNPQANRGADKSQFPSARPKLIKSSSQVSSWITAELVSSCSWSLLVQTSRASSDVQTVGTQAGFLGLSLGAPPTQRPSSFAA